MIEPKLGVSDQKTRAVYLWKEDKSALLHLPSGRDSKAAWRAASQELGRLKKICDDRIKGKKKNDNS